MSELRNPPESDDFDWVNAWATATPATGDAPKQYPMLNAESASDFAEQHAPQEAIAAAPARVAADTQSREAITQHPTEVVAPRPPVTAQPNIADMATHASHKRGPDVDQFVHPATRRFFAALHTSTRRSEAPAAADAQAPAQIAPAPASSVSKASAFLSEPAPAGVRETAPVMTPVATTTNQPTMVESAEASLAPDASQLERDIADIEGARDALLEPVPFTITELRKARSRLSALRHAESVPILVGSVVGATLLLVFGAAASLISLR